MIGKIIGNESFEFGSQYFENNLSDTDILKSNLRLVSNPVSIGDNIRIINSYGLEKFHLYSITGQRIPILISFLNGITRISTNNLVPGIYILKSDKKSFKVIIR